MSDIIRPSTDILNDGMSIVGGESTLYESIDEVSSDEDTTYICNTDILGIDDAEFTVKFGDPEFANLEPSGQYIDNLQLFVSLKTVGGNELRVYPTLRNINRDWYSAVTYMMTLMSSYTSLYQYAYTRIKKISDDSTPKWTPIKYSDLFDLRVHCLLTDNVKPISPGDARITQIYILVHWDVGVPSWVGYNRKMKHITDMRRR